MTGALSEQTRGETTSSEPTREVPVFTPVFDIVESDADLTLYGDLPGVKQDQIDVRYENEQLIIHGKVTDRAENIDFLRQEYGVGDFLRRFEIGESIDKEGITAEVHNGVLTVHLPKAKESQPRRIEVKST